MSKITSSIFTSLDGFAGRKNGDISWFKPSNQFFDYSSALIQNAGTAIYGRKTFEMMNAYWPTAANQTDASKHDIEHGNWYNKVQKIVFSNTLTSSSFENVEILGQNSIQEISKIKENSEKDMVIFGSPTVVSLLTEANLIDEYYIFISPTILGEGIPLFKNIHSQKNLKLSESKQLETGVVFLHYQK